jgi:hypothetical protein
MDAIISLYNMIATGTHNCSMSAADHTANIAYFDMFVAQEIAVWRDFHSYWLDPDPTIPTYVVRYEDLLNKPKESLTGLFQFLLDEKNLEGTLIEELIKQNTLKGTKKQVYKPRVGKINSNRDKFSQSQISQMKKLAGQMIRRLGYLENDNPLDETDTGIFSDDEDIEESKDYECDSLYRYKTCHEVKMRYRYHEFNKNTISWVTSEDYLALRGNNDLPKVEINYEGDLIRQKTARDPGGRGSRLFKKALRGHVDIVDPDGKIIKRALASVTK